MTINILAFGAVRELLGKNKWQEDIPKQMTVKDLHTHFLATYPELNEVLVFNIAVNESYEKGSFEIPENSTIALIPPVSGG